MAVIRIDDELYEKIIELIKDENRFDFPSTKAFVDKAIYEKIKKIEKQEKEKTKNNKR